MWLMIAPKANKYATIKYKYGDIWNGIPIHVQDKNEIMDVYENGA